jgi:hypothetical protein
MPPKLAIYADFLNAALDKLPEFKGDVKRYIAPFPGWEKIYYPNADVTEKAFTSTSSNFNQYKYEAEIYELIHSKTGRDISKISLEKDVHEVLFKSGTHFQIINYDEHYDFHGRPSKIFIEMVEVP